jgi:hypothetical protein
MEAVVLTFHFDAPSQPSKRVVEAHQRLLDRLPGLRSGMALKRGGEYMFVLTFDQPRNIDHYLERPEVRDFGSQPGCYDVYVNKLDVLGVRGDALLPVEPAAVSAGSQSH